MRSEVEAQAERGRPVRSEPDDEKIPGRGRPHSARRIVRTFLDPDASAILTEISIRPATAAEVAEHLGLEAEVARRRLRMLLETGQAVRCGSARRGARTETVYSGDLQAGMLNPDELAALPGRLLDEADLALLRIMHREAAAAAAAGFFRHRPEGALGRLVMPVDDAGLRSAVRIHRGLLEGLLEEVGRARARLSRSGGDPIVASVQMLFLEYPPGCWPLRPDLNSSRRSAVHDRVERVMESAASSATSILDLLQVSPASAGEVAGRLGAPVSKVRYELDRLLDEALVRVVATRPSRGTVDRVFAINAGGHVLSNEDIAGSNLRTEPSWGIWMVRRIFREALETIRAGTSRDHGDPVVARIPTAIDAKGFSVISVLIEDALSKLAELHDERQDAPTGGVSTPTRLVLSGLLLFEHPRDRPATYWRVTRTVRPTMDEVSVGT